MAADKHASVHWEGAGKTGKGQISTETGALKNAPYGFASRFGDDTRAAPIPKKSSARRMRAA